MISLLEYFKFLLTFQEKLSLADIILFSLIYQKQDLLGKFTNISKWFERLSKEKHFQDALAQLGFSK
jgi:glutathione S-transferase